jgi:hypothetical protein
MQSWCQAIKAYGSVGLSMAIPCGVPDIQATDNERAILNVASLWQEQ